MNPRCVYLKGYMLVHGEIVFSAQDLTSPWTKCPTTELSSLLPVLGHISLSWRNLSKRKVQRRMSRSISLSLHFAVKPVETLFQSTNVFPTIECSTSQTLAARASLKLLSTRLENIHSETFFCTFYLKLWICSTVQTRRKRNYQHRCTFCLKKNTKKCITFLKWHKTP